MAASLLPMKTWINSFGDARAVAEANMRGWTVGTVDMAPLEMEYGKGQSRIMQRSLRPSCLRVRDSAANRLSLAIRRCTYLDRIVRETIKEQRDPMTVAEAMMNHLRMLGQYCVLEVRFSIVTHPTGKPYIKPAVVTHVE